MKYKEGVKALFQEMGDRLDVHDHTTFERALLALIEKEGYTDLATSFKDDDKEAAKRKPPAALMKSAQYDLFTSFLTNEEGAVSNAIELWDGIPKYFLTPKQQEKRRTDEGLAKPCEWEYSYQGRACKVEIQPALLKQKDGSYKAFFPSVTEELVEEALKKLFTDQHHGLHDVLNAESWVKFSLGMLYRDLKARGRARSRPEIKQAVQILSRCILTLYQALT